MFIIYLLYIEFNAISGAEMCIETKFFHYFPHTSKSPQSVVLKCVSRPNSSITFRTPQNPRNQWCRKLHRDQILPLLSICFKNPRNQWCRKLHRDQILPLLSAHREIPAISGAEMCIDTKFSHYFPHTAKSPQSVVSKCVSRPNSSITFNMLQNPPQSVVLKIASIPNSSTYLNIYDSCLI